MLCFESYSYILSSESYTITLMNLLKVKYEKLSNSIGISLNIAFKICVFNFILNVSKLDIVTHKIFGLVVDKNLLA
jgi:hypothetical protein